MVMHLFRCLWWAKDYPLSNMVRQSLKLRMKQRSLSMPAASDKQPKETAPLPSLSETSRELLRAIAGYPDENNASQIDQLAGSVEDWGTLLSVAQEHRLLPLAFSRLTEVATRIPAFAEEQLKDAYHRNVFHCMSNAAELIAILQAFESEQISAMPFKGIVLGSTIYPDPAARYCGDLDLLINLKDLLRATTILLGRGYDLKTSVHPDGSPALTNSYEYHFERSSDGMVVELRWRLELTQPRYRRDIGMQWIWPKRKTIKLAGVDVPNMDPETTLLVLCMHGSKHVWSRLLWVSDVAHLLARFPNLDWKRVIRDGRRLGLWRALALGVLLAHRVCHAKAPQEILRKFQADRVAAGLADSLRGSFFANPGDFPESRVPYNVKLLGFQDRLMLLLSLDFFRPNDRDLNFIRLPRPLHAFYLFVRPIRILRDKSAR
jgi:Uncharacterised nucleotidyltransferase